MQFMQPTPRNISYITVVKIFRKQEDPASQLLRAKYVGSSISMIELPARKIVWNINSKRCTVHHKLLPAKPGPAAKRCNLWLVGVKSYQSNSAKYNNL